MKTRSWISSLLLLLFLSSLMTGTAIAMAINITGVSGDALKNVQARLTVLQEELGAHPTSADITDFYSAAPINIQQALQPFGYYKAQVHSNLSHAQQNWQANFQINPGPAMRITEIKINIIGPGADDPVIQNYLQHFPLNKNQILLTEEYTKTKQHLFNLAIQQGYLTAYFAQSSILIDINKYTSSIIIELNTGPRFYFGPVSFSPSPLSAAFLKRYIPFCQGEAYSSAKLLAFQNALSGSNYFQNVLVQGLINNATNYHVPIKVNLIMRKAIQYLFGIGYGTDTGPRLTLGWNNRYVNSEGHYFNSQLVLSPVQSSLQASYVIPGSNPATDQYSLNASVLQNNLNQGKSSTEQIGLSNTLLTNNWQRTYSLNYAFEQFRFNNQPMQHSYLLIPGLSLSNKITDNPVFTNNGNRFSINTQGSLQSGISQTSFFQTEIQDKYIHSFDDIGRIIIRGDIGYLGVHDLDSFPLSMRFYAGGAQSIRGFSYQSLGPGKYLFVGSTEYQQRIVDNWYAAAFFDTGNAANHIDMSLQRSTGVGIVWASPVGVLELTLAKALSLPGQPLRIQFTMGPDL